MTYKQIAPLLVIPPVAGWVFVEFASSLPQPWHSLALGMLMVGFLVVLTWLFLANRRDMLRSNDFLVEQTYLLLGPLGDDALSKEELRRMPRGDLVAMQSSLLMYQHTLGQLRLLDMDYEEQERSRHAYRSSLLAVVDSLAGNGFSRDALVRRAPDWELWTTPRDEA